MKMPSTWQILEIVEKETSEEKLYCVLEHTQ
jgi:hypothetical protein